MFIVTFLLDMLTVVLLRIYNKGMNKTYTLYDFGNINYIEIKKVMRWKKNSLFRKRAEEELIDIRK